MELLFNTSVEDIPLMNFKTNNCIAYLACIWSRVSRNPRDKKPRIEPWHQSLAA